MNVIQNVLFDSYIGSVLLCGSAVWGFYKAPDIKHVHLKNCKYVSSSFFGPLDIPLPIKGCMDPCSWWAPGGPCSWWAPGLQPSQPCG